MLKNPFLQEITIKFIVVNPKFFKKKRRRKNNNGGGGGMSDILKRVDLSKLDDIIDKLEYLDEDDDLAPR
jgi:hypothetical protein